MSEKQQKLTVKKPKNQQAVEKAFSLQTKDTQKTIRFASTI